MASGSASINTNHGARTNTLTASHHHQPITTPSSNSQSFGAARSIQNSHEIKSGGRLTSEIADFNGHTSLVTTDGRVRNPVPNKLQGMADDKNGNFAVMHIDLGNAERSERNAAAKRTSEGTEAAAKIANKAGYQPIKRSKLAWQPQDSVSGAGGGLTPQDAKSEQARLLTLLRSVHPVVVVDQLCKALAYFGGIPGGPPPSDNSMFPQSASSNGSGSAFIGWISEIFPNIDPSQFGTVVTDSTAAISAAPSGVVVNASPQVPAKPTTESSSQQPGSSTQQLVAADGVTPIKRGRGRPKGSKGVKKKNKEAELAAGGREDSGGNEAGLDPLGGGGGWNSQAMMHSRATQDADTSLTNTPSGKKRGRPKGSKNKPKAADGDGDNTLGGVSVTPDTQVPDQQYGMSGSSINKSPHINDNTPGAAPTQPPMMMQHGISRTTPGWSDFSVEGQGNSSGMDPKSSSSLRKRKPDNNTVVELNESFGHQQHQNQQQQQQQQHQNQHQHQHHHQQHHHQQQQQQQQHQQHQKLQQQNHQQSQPQSQPQQSAYGVPMTAVDAAGKRRRISKENHPTPMFAHNRPTGLTASSLPTSSPFGPSPHLTSAPSFPHTRPMQQQQQQQQQQSPHISPAGMISHQAGRVSSPSTSSNNYTPHQPAMNAQEYFARPSYKPTQQQGTMSRQESNDGQRDVRAAAAAAANAASGFRGPQQQQQQFQGYPEQNYLATVDYSALGAERASHHNNMYRPMGR